jgi:putative mRNA 3-end processing factor
VPNPLLTLTDAGLYIPEAGVHIDPWRPVDRAVITHGHADHARPGSRHLLTARSGVGILRKRLGEKPAIEGIPFGEVRTIGGARISLHPAGHILGSAQVRVEVGGEVAVVTGDYKRQPDPTAEPFEPVRCHTLVSECTFGLPIYRWPDPTEVFREIVAWWRESAAAGRTALLLGYALGKAQRLLAGVAAEGEAAGPLPGPLLVHGAVAELLPAYRAEGIALPEVDRVTEVTARLHRGHALVVAPPSAQETPWVRKLGPVSVGFASGWMRVRGMRRRRGGRGFVLSDHVDWEGLLQTVRETGAERVGLTHGTTEPAVRWLREAGWDAFSLSTRFQGEAAP